MTRSKPSRRTAPRKGDFLSTDLYNSTWKFRLYLVWPVNEEQLKAYIRTKFNFELKSKPFDGRCVELADEKGHPTGEYIIALRKWSNTPYWTGVLSHEAMHCSLWALKRTGLQISDKSEEAYTYLQEWVFREVSDLLKRKTQALSKRSRTKKKIST